MTDPTAQAVIAASASFFIVTLIFAIMFLICKKAANRHNPQTRIRTAPTPDLTSVTISESASFDPSLDQISMPELLVATKNFSTDGIIGDGSFGLVYKARLSNGVTVAVKKLSKDAFQGFREFRAEMETLGKNTIRHPNLIRILGYCVSGDDRVLIYEFIERGSLDQWIHDTSTGDNSMSRSGSVSVSMSSIIIRPPLIWETRIKIIKGVANGLLFLHTLATPIIHRDIKASNVLLDSEFEAHIADFGLARRIEMWHSHVSTQVAGTMGYMPPEYKNGGTIATVKADVYSFGVLMIEVAAGRRPNWPIRMEDDGKEVTLVEWAKKMVAQGRIIEMIDSTVRRETLKEFEVGEYMRIAGLCTSEMSKDRPFMGEVVTLLNQL
ncbi:Receptor-like kinase lip2 [Thalictrum thalictroides]|uniref:Receptor-like kinase lip2 n=1 Tax=Thalictrum thalictroides TaxID=46969 RepID=A0A7J6VMN8_THATH|nr:Receptor-like kinase lip2 [Thalictrum thalictroides]